MAKKKMSRAAKPRVSVKSKANPRGAKATTKAVSRASKAIEDAHSFRLNPFLRHKAAHSVNDAVQTALAAAKKGRAVGRAKRASTKAKAATKRRVASRKKAGKRTR